MIISKIYAYLMNNLNILKRKFRVFILFILPNSSKIFRKQVVLTSNYPEFQQKTKITGTGKVFMGNNCSFGYRLGGYNKYGLIEIQARYKKAIIKIGDNVSTNNNLFFCSANYIEIGSNSLIGLNVVIMDHEAHGIHPKDRMKLGPIGEVIIGKNVWIGNNVTILKDSKIGDNSIVALGSVVSGIFPSNVIIGGIPAKIIRKINV